LEKGKLDQLRIEREPEKMHATGRRWLLIALFAAALAGAAWYAFKPAPLVQVRTALVKEVSGAAAGTVLNAAGYVTARRQATVSSKLTGMVAEVLIEEGMTVEEGQVLARLDNSNVNAAFQLAEAQVQSARAVLKSTEALLQEAQHNLERSQSLVEKKLTSAAELDRSRAAADSLAAQLKQQQAEVDVAARQLDVYRQQVEDSIIRAPFAGVIVAKNAQPGEIISPLSAGGGFTRTGIGTLVDMSSLEIEIDVNEAYINRVMPGQEVVATLDAYPGWAIPCHVIAIIPTADRQRATVSVRVGFDELDPRILPDMGVKVAFQEAENGAVASSGVSVPRSAIRRQDERSYVLVVSNDRIERRAVSLLAETGADALLAGGLTEGTRVVTEGPADLGEGTMVEERSE
jgi:RND family efflux transporter MFP subunit